jgi:hypothetical protein
MIMSAHYQTRRRAGLALTDFSGPDNDVFGGPRDDDLGADGSPKICTPPTVAIYLPCDGKTKAAPTGGLWCWKERRICSNLFKSI